MPPLRASILVLQALGLSLFAQNTGAPAAAYMSGADVARNLSTAVATDAAAGAAVTIAPGIVVRRRSGGVEPQYAIIHPFSTETYYIVEGTGSLVTGGTLDPPRPSRPIRMVEARHQERGDAQGRKGRRHRCAAGNSALVQRGRRHDHLSRKPRSREVNQGREPAAPRLSHSGDEGLG